MEHVLEEKLSESYFSCQDCSKFVGVSELLESTDKLALLKKVMEIQGPLEVDYRCVECRECRKCQDSGRMEKVSLKALFCKTTTSFKIRLILHVIF